MSSSFCPALLHCHPWLGPVSLPTSVSPPHPPPRVDQATLNLHFDACKGSHSLPEPAHALHQPAFPLLPWHSVLGRHRDISLLATLGWLSRALQSHVFSYNPQGPTRARPCPFSQFLLPPLSPSILATPASFTSGLFCAPSLPPHVPSPAPLLLPS